MKTERFLSVKDWAVNEQPREKFQDKGGPALSDAELLAVLLVSGVRGWNCIEVGRKALEMANYKWSGLAKLSIARPLHM